MKLRALALLTAVVCLTVAAPCAASDVPFLSDYRITSWAGGDGITLGEVRSITQDQDGYLWLASDAGLVRFDGIRFARSDIVAGSTQLPTAPTRAVYFARDGSLWAGYGDGMGIYRIRNGGVRDVYLRDQIAGLVNVITEDRSGALWVGHDDGLHRFAAGRWERIELPETGSNRRVGDVHEDRAGTLWVAASSGLYRRSASGVFERAPHTEGIARAVSEDQDGRLWTTDERTGFRRADAGDRNHLFEARGMSVFHDSRGSVWVTTIGQGVWHVRNTGARGAAPIVERATVQTGLASDENSDVFEDRDGNIWVGSIQGLNRLTPHKVMSLADIGVVRALTVGVHGTAWVGTTAGLIELTGVTPHSRGQARVVSTAEIRALHTAGDGTVWAATDQGLYRVMRGHLVPAALHGPRLQRISSIASDRRGTLWVCDEAQGLFHVTDGRLEHVAAATDGSAVAPAFAHVDDAGRLWIAFRGGVVRRLDPDGHVEQYGPAEGLTHSTVYTIHHDRLGELWIGGTDGLSRLDGNRFQTVRFQNDAPFRTATAVMDDDAGNLWVGVAFFGVIRVGREEISRAMSDASHRLRYHVYDPSYGASYPNQSYSGSSGRGADDALWFVTSGGVTVLDPRELRSSEKQAAPSRPRIEGLTADDRRYTSGAALTLPPRTSRLRIDYTVVSLSSLERIRFRYRLDGFDTTWVDGTGPRQALYTNLPPGSYRFRLQASSNEVNWDDAESDWSFAIQPMFYQTRWFYAVCALGLALAAIGIWHLRVRQVRKEVAMVFGERIRLSREIHDTLLQSLVGLALQLDSAAHDARDTSSRTRTQLVGMRKQVEDYIREVRQSIWDLRSPSLDRYGLIGALRATGERLTAGKVGFALTVTGTPRPCPPKMETHILRIGHEAVMNAVRHADARQVQMEIGFDEDVLRLRVVDDGRGFNPGGLGVPSLARHYGLASMKERATDAGGRCTIESASGSGVEVLAEFPLAPTA